MGRPFYASGFLYHSASEQILLKQLTRENATHFTFFRGKSGNGYDPQTVFRICVEGELGISIGSEIIFPVYNYIHDRLGEHFVFFAQITGKLSQFRPDLVSGWIPFGKLTKYPMSEQTRHDLIISSRVIRHLIETANLPQPVSN